MVVGREMTVALFALGIDGLLIIRLELHARFERLSTFFNRRSRSVFAVEGSAQIWIASMKDEKGGFLMVS